MFMTVQQLHLKMLLVIVLLCNIWSATSTSSTLKLTHVVFRHGDRNPEPSNLWPNNPYFNESFYPEGYGQLINEGKLRDFKLGRLLRKRFDGFLGDIWHINYLDVRSTDTNRTKMSCLGVLAGMWPPRGANVWNTWLSWQPIPMNTVPVSKDPEQLGYPLDNWTTQIYPEPLRSLAVDFYYITTNTTALRQLLAGFLLKKILSDTERLINGTLSPPQRKMFLYSAHELNVAAMVLSLEIFKLDDIAWFDSGVIFEVHEIDDVFGFKIFYIENTTSPPHGPLVIPGCAKFCPFDQFYSLVEEILPSSDALCYGD